MSLHTCDTGHVVPPLSVNVVAPKWRPADQGMQSSVAPCTAQTGRNKRPDRDRREKIRTRELSLLSRLGWPCTTASPGGWRQLVHGGFQVSGLYHAVRGCTRDISGTLAAGTLGYCSFECQLVGRLLVLWLANVMSSGREISRLRIGASNMAK